MLRFTVLWSLGLGVLGLVGCADDAPPDEPSQSGSSGAATSGSAGKSSAGQSSGGSSVGTSGQGGTTAGAGTSAGSAGASTAGGGSGPSGGKKAGDPCTMDAECPSLGVTEPVCTTDWPGGGYCTTDSCAGPQNCLDAATCATVDGSKRCLKSCDIQAQCREGYVCEAQVCIPGS